MPRICVTAFLLLMASTRAIAVPQPPHAAPTAKTIPAHALVGKWYVDPGPQDGVLVDTVVTRNSDRSIVLEFRFCDGDKLLAYTEEGTWRLTGDLDLYSAHTRMTRTADGTPPDERFYDERYRIEQVLPDRLVYRGVDSGDRFEARRVPQDFAPPADMCVSRGDHRAGR